MLPLVAAEKIKQKEKIKMAKGRKKKPEEQKQSEKITIWITPSEKAKLIERAGNISVSQYFRENRNN